MRRGKIKRRKEGKKILEYCGENVLSNKNRTYIMNIKVFGKKGNRNRIMERIQQ